MKIATHRPDVRGFLMHITHYDVAWCRRKAHEKPFDLDTGLAIVDKLAAEGFNLLVIDCEDGVRYKSHPELARHYTVPMRQLKVLTEAARRSGLEVVPKLNFSNSEINQHNHWMHDKDHFWGYDFHDAIYRTKAWDLINELIAICRPERFFNIGMDEDHTRSYSQYVRAIRVLRDGLRAKRLRAVMWNDSAVAYPAGDIYKEKALAAEARVPKDVVHVLWQYNTVPRGAIRRIRREGFELWGAPAWKNPAQAAQFRDAVLQEGGKGLLMTMWMPCRPKNRRVFLDAIHTLGPIYRGER